MKKMFAYLQVVLLLIMVCLPAAAFADSTIYTEGNLYYIIEDNSITIVGCFGDDEIINVPASIAGIPVNTIAPGAFANSSASVINLPDTIMEVQEGATGTAEVIFDANTDNPVQISGAEDTNVPDISQIETNPENQVTGPDEADEIIEEPVSAAGTDEATDTENTGNSADPDENDAGEPSGSDVSDPVMEDDFNPETVLEESHEKSNSRTAVLVVGIAAAAAVCIALVISKKKTK